MSAADRLRSLAFKRGKAMASIARLHLDNADRRRAERFDVNRPGTLSAFGAPKDVLIENISSTGCLTQCDLVLPFGTIASIALPGLNARSASLVRQEGNHLGWQFLFPLKPGEIEIARSAEPRSRRKPGAQDEVVYSEALLDGVRPKAALRIRLYLALAMLDAAALAMAFAQVGLFNLLGVSGQAASATLAILFPMYMLLAINGGAFSLDALKKPAAGIKSALKALGLAAIMFAFILFYLHNGTGYSRMVLAIGIGTAALVIAAGRLAFGNIIGRKLCWRFTNDLLLLDGTVVFPTNGELIVFADKAGLSPSMTDPALFDRLGKMLRHCDRVILACPAERRAAWSAMMKGAGIKVEMLSPELEELQALGIGQVGGRATVVTTVGPLRFRDQLVKRLFDIAVSGTALLLLLPVLAAVAIAIKLDSPGPVFFRQPRIGFGNRMFNMLKFRSMYTASLDKNASKLTQIGDVRVTRVGNFLRRTSLDELPQLVNVLMGQMSVVGPRPHATGALAGEALYWEVDQRYWERHAVVPGMTGLAQVRGHRGTTFEHVDLINRLQADLEYLADWSLKKDLFIIFRTVRVLLHPNAF